MAFYSGVDDFFNGQVSGELMLKARDAAKAAGKTMASENGNLLEIKFAPGYQASEARTAGFGDATKDAPFDILASEYAGFDNETGYNTTSQLIAANKSKGIDFLYAHNDALAAGAIQAIKEAGLVPGKDIWVVGGTCHGDLSALEAGEQFGSGLQAARLEGQGVLLDVARYFANDMTVNDGKFYGEPTAGAADGDGPDLAVQLHPEPGRAVHVGSGREHAPARRDHALGLEHARSLHLLARPDRSPGPGSGRWPRRHRPAPGPRSGSRWRTWGSSTIASPSSRARPAASVRASPARSPRRARRWSAPT